MSMRHPLHRAKPATDIFLERDLTHAAAQTIAPPTQAQFRPRTDRLRWLGSYGRGRGTLPRGGYSPRPLFAGVDLRRDQLQLLPAASGGNVCTLARQRAQLVSLFREDPEGHYARRTLGQLRAAARCLPRIRDTTRRHARLLAGAIAPEPRIRSGGGRKLFYSDARTHGHSDCAGSTARELVHEKRGHLAEVEKDRVCRC